MNLVSAIPRKNSRIVWALGAGTALLLSSCTEDRNLCIFGYTTRPNYDENIKTVYVPIFKNKCMYRGLEFDLTKAVVQEIESKTPFKVESDCSKADTELIGTVISLNKNILNRNQLNEVREAETVLAVEVVWRDRRTGEILSQPRKPGEVPLVIPSIPAATAQPEGPLPPPLPAPPTMIVSTGGFIPELGESMTTAQQQNIKRLATQIVSMMEKAW
jgi:hypothetical protein